MSKARLSMTAQCGFYRIFSITRIQAEVVMLKDTNRGCKIAQLVSIHQHFMSSFFI